jgi:peptide/nickel transport system permease protein
VATTASVPAAPAVSGREAHPILDLVGRRTAIGIVTLVVVSAVVFLATQVLPGNATSP